VIAGADGLAAQPTGTQVTVDTRIVDVPRTTLQMLGVDYFDVAAVGSASGSEVDIDHRSSGGGAASGSEGLGTSAFGVDLAAGFADSPELANLPVVGFLLRSLQLRGRVERFRGRASAVLSGIDPFTQDPDAVDELIRECAALIALGVEIDLFEDVLDIIDLYTAPRVAFAPSASEPRLSDVIGIAPLGVMLGGPPARRSQAGRVTLTPWIGVRFEEATLRMTFTEAGSTRTFSQTENMTELSYGADLNLFLTDDIFVKLGWTRDHLPAMTVTGTGPINTHTATSRATDIDRVMFGLGVRLN
jgi:hypothetical protein